jgi:hypothetical protein
MIVARFEFKPEYAASFIMNAEKGQNVTEVIFESVESLVSTMKEFEDYLVDCLAIVNGKVLSLSSFTVQ